MPKCSAPEPLSRRESEIARAYAAGRTYRAIADELLISPATVRTHLGTVYRKLGVSTKIALAHALEDRAPAVAGTASAGTWPGAARPRVAVLSPLHDAADEALADGLAESVTAWLSRFRALLVVARASTRAYRDPSRADLARIAQELGVRYVITGSVRRSCEQLRVGCELVDVETGQQVWTRIFERRPVELFGLLDDLTHGIVAAVAPEIEAQEIVRAQRRLPASLTAWELCCRGVAAFPSPDADRLAYARTCFEQAMVQDPGYAAPVAHLARTHFYEVIAGDAVDPRASVERGLAMANQALALDEREDAAYAALGYCLTVAGRFDEAIVALDHGLQLNPNNFHLYNARALARLFSPDGDYAQVQQDLHIALSLSPNDPLRWTAQQTMGWAHLAQGGEAGATHAMSWFHRASTVPFADWHVFIGAAIAALALDRRAEAVHRVGQALTRRHALTLERVAASVAPLLARAPRLAGWLAALVGHGLPADAGAARPGPSSSLAPGPRATALHAVRTR